ncbi:MAG: hypothetical protein OEY62_04315, partial [Acidimicrobiia bacterium]|nr:hypothetical protein [Acidimicrobiia bacterium]
VGSFVVAATGCTMTPDVESTTTTTLGGAASAEEALTRLFDAVVRGNYRDTATLTFDDQLALMVSLEGYSASDTVSMLSDGLPDLVRDNFWKSFSTAFPAFAEEELAGVLIGGGEEFSVEGKVFATVAVALRQSEGSGNWIARRDAQGRWRLDLFATFGPMFATPFRDWLGGLDDSLDADVSRAALADQRASLLAALQRKPFGPMGPETMAEVDQLLFEAGLS